jgi:beta-lactamase regulating signal transducer with metallopeptidase domain
MSRAAMAVTVVLASYAALNIALTAVVGVIWKAGVQRQSWSPSTLLGIRLLPSVGGMCLAVGICLPAFLRFEPHHGPERPGGVLIALALLTIVLIAAGAARGIRAGLATRAITNRWTGLRRQQSPGGIRMDVVDVPAPVVAVSGLWRPRVLIGRDVASQCTSEELALIIAHEEAHVRSRDNFKQVLMLVSPDLPGALTINAALEERWRAATELAADEYATQDSPERRVRLAAALVKMARLALTTAPHAGVASALIGTHGIEARIRRLLEHQPRRPATECFWIAPVLLAASMVLAVAGHRTIHSAIEQIVRFGQ